MTEGQDSGSTRRLADLLARYPATFVYLIGEDADDLEGLTGDSSVPALVATWRQDTINDLRKRNPDQEIQELSQEIVSGINALPQIRDALLAAYVEGWFSSTDKVLVVARMDEDFELALYFDMAFDESITRLKKELEYRADIKVIETVLQIASEIAREGRERGHVGALFVVGDTDRLKDMTRPLVLNPFRGHEESTRNLLDSTTWETVKEFSQIDGAIAVREDGIVEAAGLYIEVKQPLSLPSGLGGRHLAAAAATKETKAIGIVVSETGVIRVFKDGEIILRIGVV